MRLSLGFSPCPNDTFMFHGLLYGPARMEDPGFDVVLEDIESLNSRAADPSRRLQVTKLSLPAFAAVQDIYELLPAGAALGHGVGPLVVQSALRPIGTSLADLRGLRVAIPGRHTTAAFLLKKFTPVDFKPVEMRFDRIVDAVAAGHADAGVIIHESRFTHADAGLVELADLGVLWEQESGLPLPLGVIVADRSLAKDLRHRIAQELRLSVEAALADPSASRAYVRAHAQEMSEEVCARHIALYVNRYSVDLGDEGHQAIRRMVGFMAPFLQNL